MTDTNWRIYEKVERKGGLWQQLIA
nr:unnamed protein product [Callosobruchus analis]CAI5836323.1 unnamed protein product [Callosobruchus analis]CAI5852722.1 unnamed protein product [Callosobruchus analis]